MSYVHILNEDSITVINLSNGNQISVYRDSPSDFEVAVNLIKTEDYSEFEKKFDKKTLITKFGATSTNYNNFRIEVSNGVGVVCVKDQKYPLADVFIKKIEKMSEQGFTVQPLINFISNLYKNPSQVSIDELFLFLESNDLPITDDGHFVAYKIVKSNYKDIYTGTFSNIIGSIIEVDRDSVDTDRNNTCSHGLHFCSRSYLDQYGSSSRDTDRCLLVKINPADVVSIPSDYNNAKGRTWRYEVIGEMPAGWRSTLPSKDFTDCAVVVAGVPDGYTYDPLSDDFYYEDEDESNDKDDLADLKSKIEKAGYFFDTNMKRWRDINSGKIISRSNLGSTFLVPFQMITELE